MCSTEEGFETTIATSYTGHFLLAHLLLPELRAATPSRIIWLSSSAALGGTGGPPAALPHWRPLSCMHPRPRPTAALICPPRLSL